eukprot:TRINITY_DN7939_c1_g1_i3.p1 TRINITY_DN7939_c1_g1~~TRINITY_DN7939_c1_g1_i3.p1  ORF type:complete len:634 (+),score=146.80 TRINITY_DN7939_c1_g1_i3:57-1958(+)
MSAPSRGLSKSYSESKNWKISLTVIEGRDVAFPSERRKKDNRSLWLKIAFEDRELNSNILNDLKDVGKPHWNETFDFEIEGQDTEEDIGDLFIDLYDRSNGEDHFVAGIKMACKHIILDSQLSSKSVAKEGWYPLINYHEDKDRKCGDLHLRLAAIPPTGALTTPIMKIKPAINGIVNVYTPPGRCDMDFVFIHGINSNSQTWVNEDHTFYWPEEWLIQDFPSCRILFVDHATLTDGIDGLADRFLKQFISDGIGKKPYVLIGHSYGGLIIKKIVNESCRMESGVYTNLWGMIFLGTPRKASNLDLLVPDEKQKLKIELKDEDYLSKLDRDFRRAVRKHPRGGEEQPVGVVAPLICMESEEITRPGLPRIVAVPTSCAKPKVPGHHPPLAIFDADHIGLSRPSDRFCKMYQTFIGHLRNVLNAYARTWHHQMHPPPMEAPPTDASEYWKTPINVPTFKSSIQPESKAENKERLRRGSADPYVVKSSSSRASRSTSSSESLPSSADLRQAETKASNSKVIHVGLSRSFGETIPPFDHPPVRSPSPVPMTMNPLTPSSSFGSSVDPSAEPPEGLILPSPAEGYVGPMEREAVEALLRGKDLRTFALRWSPRGGFFVLSYVSDKRQNNPAQFIIWI